MVQCLTLFCKINTMKKTILYSTIIFGFFAFASCSTSKQNTDTKLQEKIIHISGTVSELDSGKDGYMAMIKTDNNENYKATISIINLQKSGSTYKTLKIGDNISVSGPTWHDADGNKYIKVEKLN